MKTAKQTIAQNEKEASLYKEVLDKIANGQEFDSIRFIKAEAAAGRLDSLLAAVEARISTTIADELVFELIPIEERPTPTAAQRLCRFEDSVKDYIREATKKAARLDSISEQLEEKSECLFEDIRAVVSKYMNEAMSKIQESKIKDERPELFKLFDGISGHPTFEDIYISRLLEAGFIKKEPKYKYQYRWIGKGSQYGLFVYLFSKKNNLFRYQGTPVVVKGVDSVMKLPNLCWFAFRAFIINHDELYRSASNTVSRLKREEPAIVKRQEDLFAICEVEL